MQNRKRIRSARLVADRHENPAAAEEHLEDPRVVRLKPYAAHRASDPELSEIARAPLQRIEQGASYDHRTDRRQLDSLAFRAERPFDERGSIGRVFRENAQRFGRKAGLL